jgi:hypothetical protein
MVTWDSDCTINLLLLFIRESCNTLATRTHRFLHFAGRRATTALLVDVERAGCLLILESRLAEFMRERYTLTNGDPFGMYGAEIRVLE